MNVSAIIVTRGNVDLDPVLSSLPDEWEILLARNDLPAVLRWPSYAASGTDRFNYEGDLAVYGRYHAIQHARHEVIYVQDDDCIVSDPQAIVDAWRNDAPHPAITIGWHQTGIDVPWDGVVCNMPQRFRHDFYTDHGLVGFGAAFHRDAPARAFTRFLGYPSVLTAPVPSDWRPGFFLRTCDIVFTALTPRVLVDVAHADREFASDSDRMWRQPEHVSERQKMRDLVAKVAAA